MIKRYGPRESGNANCFATQKHIKKEMDTFADETGFETYKMAPKAFLHFTKTVSLAIILAVCVCLLLVYLGVFDRVPIGGNDFFLPQCIVGFVVLVSLLITAVEFLFYKQFCDVFYKKIEARNFYAKRKPTGEVKRRIVISGHCDAAYEWRHIYYSKKLHAPHLMGLLMGWAIGGAFISLIVAILAIVANFTDMGAFGAFLLNYSCPPARTIT